MLQTATPRQPIEGYLAWKWEIQTSLDAGHPYKNEPPTLGEVMAESYTSYGTKLTTTDETTILTSVTGTSIVNGIHIANVDASNSASVTVTLYKGATGYVLIKAALVPIQASLQILDAPIPINTGDTIKATASNANRLEIVASVLEIT